MTDYDPKANGENGYLLWCSYMRHTTKGRDCPFNGGTCTDPECFEQCKELPDAAKD
jgi:hypothetical protein